MTAKSRGLNRGVQQKQSEIEEAEEGRKGDDMGDKKNDGQAGSMYGIPSAWFRYGAGIPLRH